jgi:hypothetical protein
MTNGSRQKKADSKSGLVQFRADDRLLTGLNEVATRLNLPVGVLARLWVSERLSQELSFDISTIEAWREKRYQVIDKIIEKDFNPGPIVVIHLVPFQKSIELDLENIRQTEDFLPPVERVDEFVGRINFDGYQTVKQFKTENKLAGTVQVFRSGQLESIREVATDEHLTIFADNFDDDIIRAIWSYSCALEALEIKPPVALFVGFKRFEGTSLKSKRFSGATAKVQSDDFRVPGISINDWNDVNKIENAAKAVKRVLDRFANSVGLPRSMSYSAKGEWLGAKNKHESQVRKAKPIPRTEVLELLGTNRTSDRVNIVLFDRDTDFKLGKVRPPYLEPTESSRFKFIVNQDEMSAGAKQRLADHYEDNQPVVLGIGTIRFTGKVTRLEEGSVGGTFNDINTPQQMTLRFDVTPEQYL